MADGEIAKLLSDLLNKPITILVKSPLGVRLENEVITALQTVVDPNGAPVAVGGTGAGAPITVVLMRGKTLSGAEEPIRLEDNRDLRIQLLLDDGTPAPVRWQVASANGEAKVALCGTDEAGNVDIQRTDPNRVPWQREYKGIVQVDPVNIPAADWLLWNPGATATELYEVYFLVVNNDAGGAPVTVSVGVDLAAGGALAAPEYWMFNEVIPYPGNSSWRGPFQMAGDDDIRGVASAALDAAIHFFIRRIDLGA